MRIALRSILGTIVRNMKKFGPCSLAAIGHSQRVPSDSSGQGMPPRVATFGLLGSRLTQWTSMGGSINEGTPIAGWFISRENPSING